MDVSTVSAWRGAWQRRRAEVRSAFRDLPWILDLGLAWAAARGFRPAARIAARQIGRVVRAHAKRAVLIPNYVRNHI